MKSSTINNIKKDLVYLLSFLFIYFIFFLIYFIFDKPYIIPSPNDILKRSGQILLESYTWKIIFHSLIRLIVSLAISISLGLILGFVASLNKYIEYFLKPIITILRVIPLASIIIIVLMISGLSKSPYIITILMIFPIIYQNTLEGVKSIDKEYKHVYMLDSGITFKVIFKVQIPLIFNYLKAALISSIGLAVKVLAMAELFSQTKNSIGAALNEAKNNLEFDLVFAYTLILIVMVLLIEGILFIFKKSNEE